MSLWVRFENKTEYEILYLKLLEENDCFSLLKNELSEYIFSDEKIITPLFFDKRGHLLKSDRFLLSEGKLNTIILTADMFS